MSKELINKIEKVFKDSTYCGWGEVLEELKQALEDKDNKYETLTYNYNDTVGWNNELTDKNIKLQSKLDKIEEVVNTFGVTHNKNLRDYIKQILGGTK
jgi:uncharacterized protein YrzB (UPF0473 family)